MARQIRSADAQALLEELFPLAEDDFRDKIAVTLPAAAVTDIVRWTPKTRQLVKVEPCP
jgi:hypothetical protein